jgi:hypothetical protein
MSYKRRELKVHKDGFYDLAKAVMHQWNTDGRPRGDEEGISLWAELLQSHQQQMMRGVVRQGELKGVRRK